MLKKTKQTKSLSLSTEQMNKQHPKRSMQTLSRDVVILAMDSQQSGHKDNGKLEKAHLFSFASFFPNGNQACRKNCQQQVTFPQHIVPVQQLPDCCRDAGIYAKNVQVALFRSVPPTHTPTHTHPVFIFIFNLLCGLTLPQISPHNMTDSLANSCLCRFMMAAEANRSKVWLTSQANTTQPE